MRRRFLCALAAWSLTSFVVAQEAQRLDRHGEPLPAEAVQRLGTAKLHGVSPYRLAWAPDSSLLAGSLGDAVVLWNAPAMTRRGSLKLAGPHAYPRELIFSPDAKFLLTVPGGSIAVQRKKMSTLSLWDVPAKKEIRLFGADEAFLGAFSADGRYLAAAFYASDVHLAIWDLQEKHELIRFDTKIKSMQQIVYAPGDKKLLGRTGNDELVCWDVKTGAQVFMRQNGSFGAMSADGTRIVQGSHLCDPLTGTVQCKLAALETPRVFGDFFSHDAKTYVALDTGSIRLIDSSSGKERDSLSLPIYNEQARRFGAVACASNGKALAVAMHGQTLLYDLTRPAAERERGWLLEPAWQMRFSPDDRTLLCSNGPPHLPEHLPRFFSLWDVKTGAPVRPMLRRDGAAVFQFLDNGARLFLAGPCEIQDTRTGEITYVETPAAGKERLMPETPLWIASDGATLVRATSHTERTVLQTVRVKTREVLREIKIGGSFPSVSPDGQTVFTAPFSELAPRVAPMLPGQEAFRGKESLIAWNAADGSKRFTLEDKDRHKLRAQQGILGPASDPAPHLLAFSPDGKLFAWFQDGLHVHISDLATGETMFALPADLGKHPMSFSRDGKMLALAGAAPALLEVATGKVRHEFSGAARACSVAFSHDHKLLAAGYPDATVLLWDVWGTHSAEAKQPLTAADLDAAWTSLADDDGRIAFAAMRVLHQRGDQAVPVLKKKLEKLVDKAKFVGVPALIRDLDSNQFAKRQAAEESLRQLGVGVRPALRIAARDLKTLEGRRRAERILETSAAPPAATWMQALRALEVLEALPGDAATKALQAIAQQDENHPLAIEAKASILRRK